MSNATVYQGLQIGVEPSAGVPVSPTRRLLAIGGEPRLVARPKLFKPRGQKYVTSGGVNSMWIQVDLSGVLCYNSIAYLLNGMVNVPGASTGTGPYTWPTFISNPDGPDTVKTFSGEVGYAQGIWKWCYGTLGALRLSFDENGGNVGAVMFGKAIPTDSIMFIKVTNGGTGYSTPPSVTITPGTTGSGAAATAVVSGGAVTGVYLTNGGSAYATGATITFGGPGSNAAATAYVGTGLPMWSSAASIMDPVVAEIAALPNLAHHNTLSLTPTYGSLGSSQIGYRRFEWGLEDVRGPAYFVKGTNTFTDANERPTPKNSIRLTVEKTVTTSGYFSQFKLGTTMFYQHVSTDGTDSLTITGAAQIEDISETDEDGIACLSFSMQGQRHTSINSGSIASAPYKIDLINGVYYATL